MRALAIRLIELTLGVKTSHTIWQEHLYELEGFRKIVGEELIARLKNPNDDVTGVTVNIPVITVGLDGKEPYKPFARLYPYEFHRGENGQMVAAFTTEDDLICFRFWFDWPNERLRFDIQRDFKAVDSGSLPSAENMAEVARFVWDYWRNGKLVITDADTGERLSRKDAFVPVNVILRGGENVEQQVALEQAARRRGLVERLVSIVRNDPDLMTVLTTIRGLGLNDWLVFSGAVYQAAWNDVTGRPPGYGVKDFDVGYFDEDVSWDAEDVVIKRVAEVCAKIGVFGFQPFDDLVGVVINQERGVVIDPFHHLVPVRMGVFDLDHAEETQERESGVVEAATLSEEREREPSFWVRRLRQIGQVQTLGNRPLVTLAPPRCWIRPTTEADHFCAPALMPPEQYAYFEALNAWTGRADLIRLRHLDEFNQTAGRNLGFRAPLTGPPPRHVLLINRRLFESLTPLLAFARYDMREVVTRRLQKAAKAHAKNPTTYAAKPGASAKDRLAALRNMLQTKDAIACF